MTALARRAEPLQLVATGTAAFERPKEQVVIAPVGIFVARKREFEVFVTGYISAPAILDRLFRDLPLVDYGWDRSITTIALGQRQGDGFLWIVRSGQ